MTGDNPVPITDHRSQQETERPQYLYSRISPNIYISPRAAAIAVSSTDQPVRGGPQRYPLPAESCGTRRGCSRRGHGDAAVPVDDPLVNRGLSWRRGTSGLRGLLRGAVA